MRNPTYTLGCFSLRHRYGQNPCVGTYGKFNFCREVLKPPGSYAWVFIVADFAFIDRNSILSRVFLRPSTLQDKMYRLVYFFLVLEPADG